MRLTKILLVPRARSDDSGSESSDSGSSDSGSSSDSRKKRCGAGAIFSQSPLSTLGRAAPWLVGCHHASHPSFPVRNHRKKHKKEKKEKKDKKQKKDAAEGPVALSKFMQESSSS